MIRTVLFDLDGTLVDSAPDLCAAANRLRVRRSLPALPFAALRESTGHGARSLINASLAVKTDAALFEEIKAEFLTDYTEHCTEASKLFDGTLDLIDALCARDIAFGIVTNKAYALANRVCEAFGLLTLTDCLIGGDTAAKGKPAPDSIWAGIAALNADPATTVYVGDDANDTVAAHAAGIRSIAVAWGYTAGTHEQWGADAVANTHEELFKLICNNLNRS